MKKEWNWLMMVILLLAFTGLACSAMGGSDETATESAPVPAATTAVSTNDDTASSDSPADEVTPTVVEVDDTAVSPGEPQKVDDAEILVLNRAKQQLAELNSYRMEMEIRRITTDGSQGEVMRAEVTYVTEPPATSMTFYLSGMEGMDDMENIGFVQIGNMVYTTMPGFGCFSGPAEDMGMDENPFAEMTDPSTFLGELNNANRMPNQVINGVEARHYVFDETSLEDSADGEFNVLEGHIYVAEQGNYVVRFVMEAEGRDFLGSEEEEGQFHIEFNILEVNESIEVVAPAECDVANMDLNYPVMEDAQDVFSFEGFVSYQTNATFDSVVAFYRAEMAEEGWTLDDDELLFGGTAIFNFTRGDEKTSVTISLDETTGDVTVLIVSQ